MDLKWNGNLDKIEYPIKKGGNAILELFYPIAILCFFLELFSTIANSACLNLRHTPHG